jgi:phenylacetate-CoA ligase
MTPLPYLSASEYARLQRDYPVGEAFLRRFTAMPRTALEQLQEERFRDVVDSAWQTPFYRRLWTAAGVEPDQPLTLADLPHLPIIDKTTLMADIDEHPPFGSLAERSDGRRPQVLQTTSGTTGPPQPVLWGAWGREVQNALLGRTYQWLGVGSGDIVHSVYGHGPVNGGHYVREAVTRYTDALLLSAGTGLETRSERQVALMAQFGVTVLAGFSDYLRRLADVARSAGLEPGRDLPVRTIIGHLPQGSRDAVEKDWAGARAYDWYGVADTGVVAAEGPERDGQWLWEDANVVELLDPDTHLPVEAGDTGSLVVTSLGKSDVAPLIRFDTHDLSALVTTDPGHHLPFRRIKGLLGRSDQMVKLRGINVYPTALAQLVKDVDGATGEYFCRLETRSDGAEHIVIVVESERAGQAGVADTLTVDVADQLSTALGVKVGAELALPGSTAEQTGLLTRQKPLRLIDAR